MSSLVQDGAAVRGPVLIWILSGLPAARRSSPPGHIGLPGDFRQKKSLESVVFFLLSPQIYNIWLLRASSTGEML